MNDQIQDALNEILAKLHMIERRLIVVESNIDILVDNARVHNVVRATITPIPRAVASER